MVTNRKGRGKTRLLLLALILCCTAALGLGAAAPALAATLTGTVWNDANANGVLDAGDTPRSGVLVQIRSGATRGVTLATAITGPTGFYGFINVPAGTFRLVELDPPGAVSVAAYPGPGAVAVDANTIRVTVASFSVINNNNFLDRATVQQPTRATISGRVLRDTNGNNQIDTDDTGIAGVTVRLFTPFNQFLGQTTTNANGDYAFNVTPGTYRVSEIDPPNTVSVTASAGPGGIVLSANTIQVTVGAGQISGNNNFLDRSTVVSPTVGTISGRVVRDTNGNGFFDNADLPVPGATVRLLLSGFGVIAQTTTNVNGAYAFANLPPGFYQVQEIDPPNHVSITARAGAGGFVVNANTIQISLGSGVASANNDFLDRSTQVSPTVGTISGTVLRDTNGSGVIDSGDQQVPGVTVRLFTGLGAFIGQTVTDANGAYAFPNLPPGIYLVQEIDPPGVVSVAAFAGPGGFVLNANTIQVNLGSGATSGNNNFLDRVPPQQTSTISGSVLLDRNGNGFVDTGDQPAPGVTVQLQNQSGGVIAQTVTDVNGAWAFSNLSAGTYRVVEINPPNTVSIAAFSPTGVVLSADTIQFTVSGGSFGNNNFLDRATQVSPTVGTISGSVLRDTNGNGVVDGGDQVATGVTVRLFTGLGAFVGQTVTDANGAYAFPNLPPGIYLVQEIDPPGVVSVAAFAGPGGFVLNANTTQVNLGSGATSGNNNFLDRGFGPGPGTNTISGFAIRDANFNGIPDNEPGLAGMVITLRDSVGNLLGTVTTDGTGVFSFTGLASGSYRLTATPPPGRFSTNAIPGQGGTRFGAATIVLTTSPGLTNYPGHLFLAGP